MSSRDLTFDEPPMIIPEADVVPLFRVKSTVNRYSGKKMVNERWRYGGKITVSRKVEDLR